MRVVVIGAGYGGVGVALALGRRARGCKGDPPVEITLIDSGPHHVLKTELHTLAAGTLDDPGHLLVPLEGLFERLPVRRLQARVGALEPNRNCLTLESGECIEYDRLVVAAGAHPEYFGIPGLREHSTTIGDLAGALHTRRRVDELLRAVAAADPPRAEVVIGGGGLTGIEFAGELAWVLRHRYATSGAKARVSVTVVEAAPTLMPGLDPRLGTWAKRRLEDEGVKVLTGWQIASVTPDRIVLAQSTQQQDSLPYHLLVWSGGVRGNKLVEPALPTDRRGRVLVDGRLRAIDFPAIRVLGDCACVLGPDGRPVPPTAQGAVQQASWVAAELWAECTGHGPAPAPRYREKSKGVLASIGPEYGIGLLGAYAVGGRWVKRLKDLNNLRYLAGIGARFARGDRAAASAATPAKSGTGA